MVTILAFGPKTWDCSISTESSDYVSMRFDDWVWSCGEAENSLIVLRVCL